MAADGLKLAVARYDGWNVKIFFYCRLDVLSMSDGILVERFRSNVTESVSDQWGNRGANEENTGSI